MTLDKLKEALQEQAMAGAEKNFFEVIERALDIPHEQLIRVIFAYLHLGKMAKNHFFLVNSEQLHKQIREELPSLLIAALEKAMEDGIRRLLLRSSIENAHPLTIETTYLVKDNINSICIGCPERIECIAESRSTPKECLHGKRSTSLVFPLRLLPNNILEVEAKQPTGKHTLPLKAIHLGVHSDKG